MLVFFVAVHVITVLFYRDISVYIVWKEGILNIPFVWDWWQYFMSS
jgi:hypothetical protein